MLLTVSSFGECLRRFSPAEAFLSKKYTIFRYEHLRFTSPFSTRMANFANENQENSRHIVL